MTNSPAGTRTSVICEFLSVGRGEIDGALAVVALAGAGHLVVEWPVGAVDGDELGRSGRAGDDRLGRLGGKIGDHLVVLVDAGVQLAQFGAPFALAAGDLAELAPGAVVGHVQVDPGVEPLVSLLVELHAVVALVEHLDQRAGVGVVLGGGNMW
jgi:hypothetical protein